MENTRVDLYHWNYNLYRSDDMEIFCLVAFLFFGPHNDSIEWVPAHVQSQVQYCCENKDAFWPPDMVPHPNPPWDQKEDEPEMA